MPLQSFGCFAPSREPIRAFWSVLLDERASSLLVFWSLAISTGMLRTECLLFRFFWNTEVTKRFYFRGAFCSLVIIFLKTCWFWVSEGQRWICFMWLPKRVVWRREMVVFTFSSSLKTFFFKTKNFLFFWKNFVWEMICLFSFDMFSEHETPFPPSLVEAIVSKESWFCFLCFVWFCFLETRVFVKAFSWGNKGLDRLVSSF